MDKKVPSILQLKRKRNGKKWTITKSILEIETLISQKGSRTKIRFLRNSLSELLQATMVLHEELMLLLEEDHPEFNDQWIEELSFRVKTCFANVDSYLIERENDPPSSISTYKTRQDIEQWRQNIPMCSSKTESESIGISEKSEYNSVNASKTYQQNYENEIANAFSRIYAETTNPLSATVSKGEFKPITRIRRSNSVPQLTRLQFDKEDQYHLDSQFKCDSIFGPKFNTTTIRKGQNKADIVQTPTHDLNLKYELNPQLSKIKSNKLRYSLPFKKHIQKPNIVDVVDKKKVESVLEPDLPKQNAVDDWIDKLDPKSLDINTKVHEQTDIQMLLLIQQRLPRQTLVTFDGEASKWVEFITKFHDLVHKQPFLDAFQKQTYLIQHLKGEPLKSVNGFGNDNEGYVASLKRLKYMFGNHTLVAEATIKNITTGKQLPESDPKAIADFYYSVSSCINTLRKMNFNSDIRSTHVLRQTLARLPDNLLTKWAQYSFQLRKKEEPTLCHLEQWLQDRVMTTKDPYLPNHRDRGKRITMLQTSATTEVLKCCPCCNENHPLFKCENYKLKTDKEKLNFIKRNQLCFNCLSDSHSVKNCTSKGSCFAKGCKRRHHTSIHQALVDKQLNLNETSNLIKTKSNQVIKNSGQTVGVMQNKRSVYLQVAPVKVANQRGDTVETYALLDSGSQCTIITKSLCQRLSLPGKLKKVKFGTIKNDEVMPTKIVNLHISSLDGSFSSEVKNVYSLHDNNFNVPGQNVPITSESKWNYIKDINFPDVKPNQIQILIGADVPDALISNEVRKGGDGLPYASKTPLGWTLVGIYDGGTISSHHFTVGHISPKDFNPNNDLDNLVKQFWETESFGTKFNLESSISLNDKRILKILDEETTFNNGHYVVPMLWKSEIQLPDSLPMARKRFSYLTKKFLRDEAYFTTYRKNIENYLQNNYARKLTDQELLKKTNKIWYLPHHGVINVNKPGKIRTVFDAAAKSYGQSLNSNLCTGPDLLNSLVGVLLRFRKHQIAVAADIEAMFHQVRLKSEDAESVRFLWKQDPFSNDAPEHYQMLVHIFGATDSPCAASYALKRAALDQRDKFPTEVINAVLRDFYVDDFLSSVPTVKRAQDLINHLNKLLTNRGFNPTKFNSNCQSVLQAVPFEKHATHSSVVFENSITRALGVKWDLKEDCFLYSVNIDSKHVKCTKREILKKTATVFDPLGFLTPLILTAKLILQSLWKLKIDWDDPIDEDNQQIWKEWLDEISTLSKTIRIPRSFNINLEQDIQLHIFCDASERAFAAVAYIRIQECDEVRSHLVMAKSRVAPIKTLTLPRLELQGAVMAIRLKETIIKEFHHQFKAIYFWTDSMLNIQYINNIEKRFKTFVANRVSEIHHYSEPLQWRFVPGKLNPADIASRGAGTKELSRNSVWLNGPDFLKQDKDKWPMMDVSPLSSNDTEVRNNHISSKEDKDELFIDYNRFSSWRKLIRTVTWIIVFLHNCQSKQRKDFHRKLSIEEEDIGKHKLIKLMQIETFEKEIYQLRQERSQLLKGCLNKLDPFLDKQGVLRVGGRLKHGDLPYATKHQIILSAKHEATRLLGRYVHIYHHHIGKEHLLSLLRQEYWIIGGRIMAKQIVKSCVFCQKIKSKPTFSKMANLPEHRIATSTPPFFHTGIDYFGPILVKVMRSRVKRWGCIFTCLTTRAIHLEVAPSLKADDFINVLERFISRRGNPKTVHTDCGTNFKGAANELKRELERMNHLKIDESLRRMHIEWNFNPPEAPHMGGVWERMVRSVKISLNVILMSDGVVLNDYTLMTVLTEVEALINSRPLTPISDDINDLEALTPNHLLIGRASTNLSPCVIYDNDVMPRQRWKQVQSMTQQFWDRWRREYLPTLTTRGKWVQSSKNVNIGDLVMVLESNLVRGRWMLGRVTNTFPSRDGVVRKIEVKTRNGVILRPTVKIAPLELY